MEKLELGMDVKDKTTGFLGTVTAICEYLEDTAQVRIEKIDGGKYSSEWFAIGRVVVV